MHLIFSALITEKRFHIHPGTAGMREKNRASVACSTLDGLRELEIESSDFYIEFDETTNWARSEVERFIENLGFPSTVHATRLASFEQWKIAAERLKSIPTDQLLLFTNDDHVLVNPNPMRFSEMRKLQQDAQLRFPEHVVMVPLSHYPEHLGLISVAKSTKTIFDMEGTPLIPNQIPGGPILISKEKFEDFWSVDFTNGKKFVGLENPFGPSLRLEKGLYLPPREELLRHLDSYGHVGVYQWPLHPLEPTVEIFRHMPNPIRREYLHTDEIKKPRGDIGRLLLSYDEKESTHRKLLVLLSKASRIRPSMQSFRWVSSAVDATPSQIRKAAWTLAAQDFRIFLALTFPQSVRPWYLLLGILSVFIRRLANSKLTEHFIWFVTYGTSIGFLKLVWLSRRDLKKLLRTEVVSDT